VLHEADGEAAVGLSFGFLKTLFERRLDRGLRLYVELLVDEPRPGRHMLWLSQKAYALKCRDRDEMERRLKASELLNRYLLREAPI
jgi:hypothetical protein